MLPTQPFLELQRGHYSRGFKHPQSLLLFGRPFHACLQSCKLYWDFTVSRNIYWLFPDYLMDLGISSGYIASNSMIFEWKRIGTGICSVCVTCATTYLNGMNKFMKSSGQDYRVRYEQWIVWVRINGIDLPRWPVSVSVVKVYGPVKCGTRRHKLTTRFPAWGRCTVKLRMVNDSKGQ